MGFNLYAAVAHLPYIRADLSLGTSTTAKELVPYADPNAWHHVAVTYGAEEIRVYLDGAKIADDPLLGHVPYPFDKPLVVGAPAAPAAVPAEPFRGALDDLRVYGRALTPAEVQALYHLAR